MRRGTRRFAPTMVGIFVLSMVMPMAAPPMARAAPTELFFSEYIEGSSNNKALEIFNGTGAAVNLATGGYNVQMYFNGNPVAGLTINLLGTVADGDVFVLANSSASATILAQADQTNGAGWFNGDDAVVLRKGTSFIDVIGQVGFDPGTEWGTGLISTADNTLRRKGSISSGDTNGGDAFDPSIEWDGFATDTFGGLGAHPFGLSIDDVSRGEGGSGDATTFTFTVSLSSPAGPGGVTFDIATADNTATIVDNDYVANSLTGQTIAEGDSSYEFDVTVNGDAGVEPNETFSVNVTNVSGEVVSDAQGVGTIVNDDADCSASYTPIYTIQGSGSATPIPGAVTTQGVVTGDFQGPTTVGLRGFNIQDETGDGDPATSDGIFVFTGNTDHGLTVGDVVRVAGTASEFNFETEITASSVLFCNATGSVAPTDVTLPVTATTEFEKYEGMLVRFPQALVISEYFNYDRFGEVVLALPLDGETRAFTGTAIDAPGAPANARTLANSLRRITLDDGLGSENPTFTRHPNGDGFALDNYFRGGDTVANTIGVLGFDFGLYRIQPTAPADYTAVNPRPLAPDDIDGRLTVAAQNTLNFFLTLDYPTGDPLDNKCGPANNVECRGADANQPTEFTRQRDKLLAVLADINADVIGLNEIENTTDVDPLGHPTNGIVPGLNAILGAGTYEHIATGVIGTDAIRVGLIYKPGSVTPVGDFQILDSTDDPRFIDTRSRPVLAQTFMENSTGEKFTVAVNHLKSKGSACADIGDPDVGDGQANCNLTRKAAAEALVDWLATDPTGSGDPDFLIIGDLNSYAMEDPITAIKAGPDDTDGTADDYTNLVAEYLGTYAYSFVFDGQAGYLDHALSSTSLTGQVADVTEWHINADEADLLDYDTSFKSAAQDALYEPAAYRASDHDPIIVGLNLQTAQLTTVPATCETFAGGDAITVDELEYSVKKGRLSGVSPNMFSYWVQVQAAAGANSFTINELITSANFNTLFPFADGSDVYAWDCSSGLAPTIDQSSLNAQSGTITVDFTASAAGTYYIGLNFNTASVKGKSAPTPTTVHYEFSTVDVTPSTHGLDLVKP